ncbi:MAG TPA: MBL fold metallo-hydrolase [Cycloclasticus sp.]|jgi:glyoxylase-like metal-dependent hydrolase (beta-lactamase superfamily II)/rhodanese-related sulfurtransferase|nr:MBL fold metallo-hydrolase [Cycloclasticus sp.]HIL93013.1 MBL fold metallo-hydrolase [Cycloclasticus sp.]
MFFTELNNLQCKSYLIADLDAGKAAIIDPIYTNIDRYLGMLAYHKLTLDFVADTHTHADHRSACTAIKRLTGCNVLMHKLSPQPNVDDHYTDGDMLSVGAIKIKVLHTPGHTPDSVSFYVNEDRVLTGDVILIQGTGRADFAGGDAGDQYDAITSKLFTLPEETLVFPAHDYRGNTQSTIGAEKETNPRIAGKTRDEYIEIMDNLNLPLPERIQEVLQINQSEIDDDRIKFPLLAELNKVLQMEPELVKSRIDQAGADTVMFDVRELHEFNGELGHIKNSRLIPVADIPNQLESLEVFKDKEIILICRSGVRSTTAAAILKGLGFSNVNNMKDGMLKWNELGYPVERS